MAQQKRGKNSTRWWYESKELELSIAFRKKLKRCFLRYVSKSQCHVSFLLGVSNVRNLGHVMISADHCVELGRL